MIRVDLTPETHLTPHDMLVALADLDAAAVLIGTPAGARIAVTVTLSRRELLDELVPEPWMGDRWWAFVRALMDVLPTEVSPWTLECGQVVTVPIRPALERWMAI